MKTIASTGGFGDSDKSGKFATVMSKLFFVDWCVSIRSKKSLFNAVNKLHPSYASFGLSNNMDIHLNKERNELKERYQQYFLTSF